MDTTEQYIKMCERAQEVQAQRTKDNWQEGDYYATVFNSDVFLAYPDDPWSNVPLYIRHRGECIWLPRQDQLQEMVNRSHHPFGLLYDLYNFVKELPIAVNSMEQLWLAFVMKEKYNKVWSGEDWVKEER